MCCSVGISTRNPLSEVCLAMNAVTPTQKFARYEFKYLLNSENCARLESEISNFMHYDGYANEDTDHRYVVRSLYFDNAQSTNYYEKIDGVRERRKFRVRTYAMEPSLGTPIFLEEKGRHNQRTYKNRIQLAPEHVDSVLREGACDSLMDLYPGVSLVERFVFDVQRRQLFPRVLVDYMRRPYVSSFDVNFRITFDSHLTAQPAGVVFPDRTDGTVACKAGYTIVEIKFFRRIPAWFHRTLQVYDMRRLSISKFCVGMEACGLAVDLS